MTALRLCLLSLVFAGGCLSRVPGRILHPATNLPLAFPGGQKLSIAVEIPRDERPVVERVGTEPQTRLFLFLFFYVYQAKQGNVVSNYVELGPRPMLDLQQMTVEVLHRSGLFRRVVAAPERADFLLQARVHHLCGSRFLASSRSAAASTESLSTHQASASFAPYGNAVVTYELVDRRGAEPRVVWRDTVRGVAVGSPMSPGYAALPEVASRSVADLLGHLAGALQVVLERLEGTPAEASPIAVRPGFQFVVQRLTRTRAALEILTLEYPSGRTVSYRTEPVRAMPEGRPGDWLLARRRPSGERLLGERYEAIARGLARHFDLRRIDDAYHYHFFGRRGARRSGPVPPSPPAPPSGAGPPAEPSPGAARPPP